MAYANLGVAQASQMKIDEGFANIAKALTEDFGYSSSRSPEYDTFNRDLFTQFETKYVEDNLGIIIKKLNIVDASQIEKFVSDFLKSLAIRDFHQRIFFDFTFARIIQNWDIWKEKENGFTANRLLAYTQDFCLFNEDLLKSKIPQNRLQTRRYWTLETLIPEKFPNVNILNCSANDMADLDNKIPSELNNQIQPETCLRILYLIRNFSSHNIQGGASNNVFYVSFEKILEELIRAMCVIYRLP